MIRPQMQMDWLLQGLVDGVPGARHALVLTADGMRLAHYAVEEDVADRLAAICAGLQSLSSAVAEMFPGGDQRTRMIVIEVGGGFFYVMAAGEGAFVAVVADEGVDAGLMGRQLRDLVVRIGEHLASPARRECR
ncbi:putative regulator of Ras-like GTPase activity (Roadblock/LC7/MglB family) [Catenulispora sp. MAP12-49]|uniref:roadblock/LC7 domain-containing protein n=1 Tax=unclassified Catenulispora TaxID=414885 RepID=UPI003519511D